MSSNNDDTVLPTRRQINSGGLDGDTVLPSQNATGIHVPGDVIDNRYTVIREIGRGGMGVVYEVEDAVTGDHYAVKRLLPAYASRPEIVQQFRTEGAASIRFTNQSRYFVSTQTVGLDDGHPYIVMQLVRYPTLRNRLDASGGRLGTEEALPVLMEIASGLADLHSLGYIHRDLKPDNVFIRQQASDVHVMLVDFGLTKYGSDATATALGGAGTERYASPEQKKGLPTTATSDIYSFGVVAFEVLTGELPGVGDQVTDYADGVPPDVASIIMQCLSTRPERRPIDGRALRAAMSGATPIALPEPEVAVAKPAPKSPPTKLSSSLRFPDLQVGAKVAIDGDSLSIRGDYHCELDEGTTKSVAVVVTWEGVDLFRDSVVLRAGDSKAIPTRKAYRIDCDVPDWCEVKNAKGQRVVFPVKGLLSNRPETIRYGLSHQGRVFESLAIDPAADVQRVQIPFGIGTLRIKDVPDGCQVRVNGETVSEQYLIPIANGTDVSLSVSVYDIKSLETYRESIDVQAGVTKKFQVPKSAVAGPVQTSNLRTSPRDDVGLQSSLTVPVPETSEITRRLVIGGGIAAVLGGSGWFVCGRFRDLSTIEFRDTAKEAKLKSRLKVAAGKCQSEFPHLSRYIMGMRVIPAGKFFMGSDTGNNDEKPIHEVILSYYVLGATPVTVAVWKEYCAATGVSMPTAPSWGWIDDHPAVNVSWNDIMGLDGKGGFCAWASDIAGFRLTIPTEAQFEYAARGGQGGLEYPWGNNYDDTKVWCSVKISRLRTAPVVRTSNIYRNRYGLTDMVGNVWQWSSDFYAPYSSASQTNPSGPTSSSDNSRCVRGGSWSIINPDYFRCAYRFRINPDIRYFIFGFRLSAGLG